MGIQQPRDQHGRWAPKPGLATDQIQIPGDSEARVQNALVAIHVQQVFQSMIDELPEEQKSTYDRIVSGQCSPADIVRIAEDPNAPTALRAAIARVPVESLVERGLRDPDWRVQASALSNVACDPEKVDFQKIETEAIFASLIL